jgi:hypothetical protein
LNEYLSQAKRKEDEKRALLLKAKEAFLDSVLDLFHELFEANVTENSVETYLQCYTSLKEDYKEKLADLVKALQDDYKVNVGDASRVRASF